MQNLCRWTIAAPWQDANYTKVTIILVLLGKQQAAKVA